MGGMGEDGGDGGDGGEGLSYHPDRFNKLCHAVHLDPCNTFARPFDLNFRGILVLLTVRGGFIGL